MLILKEALFLLLAFLDIEFTKRRMTLLGFDVELNPIILKLSRWLGVEWGVALGVLIPTGGFAILGWIYPDILTFMLGVRFCLFLFQQRAQNAK